MGGTKSAEELLRGDGLGAELPRPGDVVGGKYRVLRMLGAGGMGVVVEAEHVGLRQRVALKFLHPAVADLEVPVARFLREARAASAIRSEHVARVLDVGTLDGGAPYIVMEYLTGTDLRGILGRRGPLEVEDAVDYVLQACEALAEAHALGIVHRDIKPSNLFLTNHPDGSPLIKVLDFGIAKVLRQHSVSGVDEDNVTLTGNGLVVGSPRYMPPERLRDASNVDPRTDIWAIGIVLHELLTGESPFEAKTVSSLYYKIAADPPTPVRRLRPDVPEGLEEAILRCLAKDPAKRMPDVAKLASSLRPFAPERSDISVRRVLRVIGMPPSSSRSPSEQGPSSESRGVLTGAGLTRTARSASRRSAVLGLIGGTLLVAGALAGVAGHRVLGAPEPMHAKTSPALEPRAAPPAPTNPVPPLPSEPEGAGPSVPARVSAEALAPAATSSARTVPVVSVVPRRAPSSSIKGVRARDPLDDRK